MGLDNPVHLILLVVILLLLFGAKRLPEIGRSLGTSMREFKQSINGETPAQTQQPARPALTANAQQPAQPAAAEQASAQPDPVHRG